MEITLKYFRTNFASFLDPSTFPWWNHTELSVLFRHILPTSELMNNYKRFAAYLVGPTHSMGAALWYHSTTSTDKSKLPLVSLPLRPWCFLFCFCITTASFFCGRPYPRKYLKPFSAGLQTPQIYFRVESCGSHNYKFLTHICNCTFQNPKLC